MAYNPLKNGVVRNPRLQKIYNYNKNSCNLEFKLDFTDKKELEDYAELLSAGLKDVQEDINALEKEIDAP